MGCPPSKLRPGKQEAVYETGDPVKVQDGKAHQVDDILLSSCVVPDGFACGGADGEIYTYAKPYKEWVSWEKLHKRGINCLASRSTTVLSGGGEGLVGIWNSETRKLNGELQHDLSVTGVDFLPNDQVAMGSRNGVVKVWDLERKTCLAQCHTSRNVCTAIRTWESGFVQTSEDLKIYFWSPETKIISSNPSGPDQLICLDVYSNYAICGSKGFSPDSCCIHVMDIRKNLQRIQEPESVFDHAVHGIRVGPDGRGIAVCKDGHFRVFNLQGGILRLNEPQDSGQLLQSVSLGYGVAFMCGESSIRVIDH